MHLYTVPYLSSVLPPSLSKALHIGRRVTFPRTPLAFAVQFSSITTLIATHYTYPVLAVNLHTYVHPYSLPHNTTPTYPNHTTQSRNALLTKIQPRRATSPRHYSIHSHSKRWRWQCGQCILNHERLQCNRASLPPPISIQPEEISLHFRARRRGEFTHQLGTRHLLLRRGAREGNETDTGPGTSLLRWQRWRRKQVLR
jgi:hypothetical protein